MPLASLSKQKLLLEFASLKHVCPEGIYVTITHGDASLWSGVLFVRRGPYSPAVLRFQISFPSQFPLVPPLITFSSDIFHPLLTPLTTFTYTTSTSDANTVSASDDERLPPGGFSLRHGFPQWFRRSRVQGGNPKTPSIATASLSDSKQQSTSSATVTVYQVLEYIRSAFSEESFLDAIPLEAAANTGAYHAWHTHRLYLMSPSDDSPQQSVPGRARKPGEWNWEGVWEERVKKGVQSSLSEQMLFGAAVGGDDIIRFSDMEPDALQRIRDDLTKGY